MDERNGTIRLVEPAHDFGTRGLTATVSRTDVEQAMRSEDGPVDLLLDVERATSDGRETQRIALGWEPQDLERLLETTNDDEISLTFDQGELERLLDEDVEAHGMRKTLAVLTVAAGMAAAGPFSSLSAPRAAAGRRPLPSRELRGAQRGGPSRLWRSRLVPELAQGTAAGSPSPPRVPLLLS